MTATVLLVAAVLSGVSAVVWTTYYTFQPLWVEHAAYGLQANVHFHDALMRDGLWGALASATSNGRHTLQPALLAIVWPPLLSVPYSHLFVAGGALCVFLLLLARYVRERTGSVALAIGSVVLCAALPGLYDERNGLGAPWPDYQAMFFLGSATVAFALFAVSARVGWLALAGTCASLAALARDTATIYAAITCGPIVVLLSVREFRHHRSAASAIRLILWCGIPALPAILLLVHRATFLNAYYLSANMWQLRQPFSDSIQNIWQLFSEFAGYLPLIVIAVLAAGALTTRRRDWTLADTVVIYAPVSFLMLLLANGYTSDVTKEVMYLAPGLVCAAVTLRGGIDLRHPALRTIAAVALTVCVVAAGQTAMAAYDRARHPELDALELRASQHALARALGKLPRTVGWQSYSAYDWGSVVSTLAFYEFGRFQPPTGPPFFNRKNYWDAWFPGLALADLQRRFAEGVDRQVDVAIVLKEPDRRPEHMEEYSFSIASYIASHVQASPAWRYLTVVETSVSGPLALYVNARRIDLAQLEH